MSKSTAHYEVSDVNVIPMIDVLLVLLCVLFLMIPSVGSKLPLEINLPSASGSQPLDQEFITIEIKEDGRVTRRDLNIPLNMNPDGLIFLEGKKVLLAAEAGTAWSNIAHVLGLITKAGAQVSVAVSPDVSLR